MIEGRRLSACCLKGMALRMLLVAVCTAVPLLGSPEQGIGSFDFEKVRQAVGSGDSGLVKEASSAAPVEREQVRMVVLRVTAYLGVVILLILVAAWFFRKGGFRSARAGAAGAMDIVETLPLGQNRMLIMIRVLDEIYLVAQTGTAVTLLDKIGGQKALDIVASSRGGGTILPFKDVFNSFMGKIRKPS